MCDCCQLSIPNRDEVLTPGCIIKIGRFSATLWRVDFGWFSFGGNRPFCGWYLTDMHDTNNVRPLQQPDLTDIYLMKF